MIESRSLEELFSEVRKRAVAAIARAEMDTGLKIIPTCTYRDDEQQRAYYEQGRTTPGRKITNEPGPGGAHSLRIAIDIAPCIKDDTGLHTFYATTKWELIAQAFKDQGFSWGGDWTTIKDKPHFQYTKGKTLKELRAMTPAQLKEFIQS